MYTYKYPKADVTVDITLFTKTPPNDIKILLIQRKNDPFQGKWALPGGFVEIEEDLIRSAQRELKEETGVEGVRLKQIGAYGTPGRDPRGRVITIAYGGVVSSEVEIKAADDALEAQWFSIYDLPPLAFDHLDIIKDAQQKLSPYENY